MIISTDLMLNVNIQVKLTLKIVRILFKVDHPQPSMPGLIHCCTRQLTAQYCGATRKETASQLNKDVRHDRCEIL